MGMFNFAFSPFITIPKLVIEFLSSYCLRTTNFNEENPYYSMRFKLNGRSCFLTKEDFDSLFNFKSEGIEGPNTIWSPNNFWVNNVKPNASQFHAGHSKSSSFSSKPLWYIHRFITYSFNARGMSNEVVSFDDLFLLNCILNNKEVALGRWLQWRLWLISDSVSGAICIGDIVSRIAQHFGISLKSSESIPYSILDEKFIKNSNKFKKMNNLFI